MTLALLLGCPDPCTSGDDIADIGGSTYAVTTTITGAQGSLPLQIRWPREASGDAPVAVVVEGGWSTAGVAGEAELTGVRNSDGIVSVHIDLVAENWAQGEDDRRGPLAREAVAAAIAYAGGRVDDDAGCAVTARAPEARTDRVVLVGSSNGGNLAAATLADADLADGPLDGIEVIGLVLWETPAGAQFVNVEHGNSEALYRSGSCTLGVGITCPFQSETLVDAGDGGPCFDLDLDGACDADEPAPRGAEDPASGARVLSPPLTVLATATEGLSGFVDEAASTAFWADRDAARLAPALVALRPGLPVMLVATEVDHVIHGLGDHPHIFGLGEILQAARVGWMRLNPGRDWTALENENDPDAAVRLASPDGWLFPESYALESQLSAAVRELADRTETAAW